MGIEGSEEKGEGRAKSGEQSVGRQSWERRGVAAAGSEERERATGLR
jgi:hypothetical protein